MVKHRRYSDNPKSDTFEEDIEHKTVKEILSEENPRDLKSIILSRNYIQVGSFIFVLVNFTPFLPSGSFFSDFNITLFWINFSIMFACHKKTNIFAKNSI